MPHGLRLCGCAVACLHRISSSNSYGVRRAPESNGNCAKRESESDNCLSKSLSTALAGVRLGEELRLRLLNRRAQPAGKRQAFNAKPNSKVKLAEFAGAAGGFFLRVAGGLRLSLFHFFGCQERR
jgi:hypothetical protein